MTNPNGSLLEMKNIVKSFPGVMAVDDVSFDIRPGEVHALVGENGAGKSTFIKILTGVYTRDSGEMLMDGLPVEIKNVNDAKHLGIAYIPQEITLAPRLSTARNIMLGEEPTKFGLIDTKALNQKAREVLDKIGLHGLDLNMAVKKLGVGERQMVMLSKALLYKPKILVLDEPTAPLTRAEVQELFKVIRRLKADGVGIVYISHRMEEIFEIADSVSVMRNGKLVATLDTKETTPDKIVTYMIGKQLNEMYPKEKVEIGSPLLMVKGLHGSKMVKGVNLTVHQGEIVGIFGLVGAGKSELAMTLAGGLPKVSGEIILNGESLQSKSPHDAVMKGLVLIPKDRRDEGLLLQTDIVNNVTLPSLDKWTRSKFIDTKSQRTITQNLMEDLSIRARNSGQLVYELSGGNQQKVVLAKWLATQDACLFIFDEPTRGVDVGAKTEIYGIIGKLVKRGAGVILMSSELPEVLAVSDRIVVFNKGQIVSEHQAANATADLLLAEAMGGTREN